MIPAWAGILAVLASLVALLGAVRLFQRRFTPPPELPRKIVHVAMGLVTLSFPWVFREAWPVLLLGVLATASLVALRFVRPLRSGVGNVLHSVQRDSLGEMAFPASVALVFWLSRGDLVLYIVPVLVLTLADATAAVIGLRYGVPRFATTAEPKSLEGSVAFFVVAFASVLVPLLLVTATGRAQALLVAAIVGLFVALLEAVAWRGLDNLFIPVGTYVFLGASRSLTPGELGLRLLVLAGLVVFAMLWRKRTTLSHRGVLEAALACYAFWLFGGPRWVAAPAALFFAYAVIPPLSDEERSHPHDARIVASNIAVGLLWVLIAAIGRRPELLYVFSIAFAAHMAENSFARLKRRYASWPATGALAVAVLKATVFVLAAWAAVSGLPPAEAFPLAAVGVATSTAAGAAAWWLEIRRGPEPADVPRAWMQAGVALAASAAALIPLAYFLGGIR